jgi:FixJ family two-component response regulator
MMRAQIRHDMATGVVDLLQVPASNEQLADVLYRAINGEEVTPTELFQFHMQTNALFRYWEDVH